MASSLVFVLLVITVVVMSEAGSLRNRRMKERDGETSNKQKRDFFSWITGKENIPDKVPKNETGSSDDNRQDQENSIQGKLQKENNTQGAPQNDNTQGTPPGLNFTQETPPEHNITQGTPPGHNISQETPGDQKQSSGEEGSSEENGSQQQPNKRNGNDEWEDIPYTENPPQVFVDHVLHEDADFGTLAMR